jgi:diguanylate cyclase (GGDEF)-like protein/PAS domain S-box-containing protein
MPSEDLPQQLLPTHVAEQSTEKVEPAHLAFEHFKAQFHHVLDASRDGVICIAQSGVILMVNSMMESIFGYSPDELAGQRVDILFPNVMGESPHALPCQSSTFVRLHSMNLVNGLLGKRKNGDEFLADISLSVPSPCQNGFTVAYIRDVSERKRHDADLLYQATHDSVTDLPNRLLFLNHLRQAITNAKRDGTRVAVLMLDLDNFKTINDSFGDAFGNELLVEIGHRLKSLLRAEDMLARLGGDEFGVLLSNLGRVSDAAQVAEKVLLSFSLPCQVGHEAVIVGGSIGLSFYPEDAGDEETLLRYADVAMYQAKQAGRGTYVVFSGAMDRRLQQDLRLHVRLKNALDAGELTLYYQPQVDIETGRIVGAEALLRWNDGELGEVSPARFIPVAEATGLILPISAWVIGTACKQIAQWANAGIPLKVAVNVSPQQLRQQSLVAFIRNAVETSGASPELLEIEITESAAMESPEFAQQALSELVSLGIGISLDDFGTGYSSLAHIKSLPITKLKIDRCFIKDLPGNEHDISIVRTIIGLARSLNLLVVAEGVETDAQRAFLSRHGCQTYQGWLFSKAVPALNMEALMVTQFERTDVSAERTHLELRS